MDSLIQIQIPVDAEAAALLADPRTRESIGRLISRVLSPDARRSELALAIAAMQREATMAGLSDADIDAELATYNSERRSA